MRSGPRTSENRGQVEAPQHTHPDVGPTDVGGEEKSKTARQAILGETYGL